MKPIGVYIILTSMVAKEITMTTQTTEKARSLTVRSSNLALPFYQECALHIFSMEIGIILNSCYFGAAGGGVLINSSLLVVMISTQ